MSFDPKDFAGSHCGCRYQQDYRPTLGRDGKKESGTLEVIKFYYDNCAAQFDLALGEFGLYRHVDCQSETITCLVDFRQQYFGDCDLKIGAFRFI